MSAPAKKQGRPVGGNEQPRTDIEEVLKMMKDAIEKNPPQLHFLRPLGTLPVARWAAYQEKDGSVREYDPEGPKSNQPSTSVPVAYFLATGDFSAIVCVKLTVCVYRIIPHWAHHQR